MHDVSIRIYKENIVAELIQFLCLLVSDLDDGRPACLWKDHLGCTVCTEQP